MKWYLRYCAVINCVLCAVVFVLPGKFSLNPTEMAMLAGISILAGHLVTTAYHDGFFNKFLKRKDGFVLASIALYAGFACVGNTLFLQSASWYHVPLWLLCALWFSPIGLAFLYVTWKVTKRVPPHAGQLPKGLWWLFAGIFFLTWTLYQLAFFPGVMSEDSLDQWRQAIGAWPLNNWHPVFHTLFIKLLMAVYESPAVVAWAQIVFMAGIAASYLLFLGKQGVPVKWLLLFACCFALMPANGIYAVTLWKDVAFTASLLWLTLALAQLLTNKKATGVNLLLSLTAVALFRHNGLVVYVLTVLSLLVYYFLHKEKVLLVCIASSVVLLLGFKLFVLDRDDVIPNSPAVKLLAPVHGLAAVMHHDGHLAPGVQQKMQMILPAYEWQTKYSDYSVAGYLFNTDRVFINNLSRVPTAEVLGMYATTFLSHPYYIVRERLNGTDYLWNITQPADAHNLRYMTWLKSNELSLQQRGIAALRTWLTKYLLFSEGIFSIVIWRVGIYTIFLLLSIFFMFKTHSKRYLLVFVPWLGCTCSLIPSMVDQEYRYVYFVFFLFGFLWFTLLPKKA
jgi:hypothetical protein